MKEGKMNRLKDVRPRLTKIGTSGAPTKRRRWVRSNLGYIVAAVALIGALLGPNAVHAVNGIDLPGLNITKDGLEVQAGNFSVDAGKSTFGNPTGPTPATGGINAQSIAINGTPLSDTPPTPFPTCGSGFFVSGTGGQGLRCGNFAVTSDTPGPNTGLQCIAGGANCVLVWGASGSGTTTYKLIGAPTVYTSGTNTYSTPAIANMVIFDLLGGGGGGGGATTGACATLATGGAGGGAYVHDTILSPAGSYTVVVGAGGTGGVDSAHNGTAGGDTTVNTTLVVAKGGGGGPAQSSASASGGSASGSTGDIKVQGGAGIFGYGAGGVCGGGAGFSGAGGYGAGPFGGSGGQNVNTAGGGASDSGKNYGGGGSGAVVVNASTNAAGGAGAGGIAVVTAFSLQS